MFSVVLLMLLWLCVCVTVTHTMPFTSHTLPLRVNEQRRNGDGWMHGRMDVRRRQWDG